MTDKKKLPYRKGVGIMLINKQKKVFVGKRIDNAEAWQMPQGGIDKGENVINAMRRELKEETGISSIKIIKQSAFEHIYDLPKNLIGKLWKGKYGGQNQTWFLVQFTGDEKEINLNQKHPEFKEWRWIEAKKLPELIVPFKRGLYEKLILEFKEFI